MEVHEEIALGLIDVGPGLSTPAADRKAEDSIPVEVHTGPLPATVPDYGDVVVYKAPDGRMVREVVDEMKTVYSGMTIAGLEDKDGYRKVKDAKIHTKAVIRMVKERRKELKDGVNEWIGKIDAGAADLQKDLEVIKDDLEREEGRIDRIREEESERKIAERKAKEQVRVNRVLAVPGLEVDLHFLFLLTDAAFEKFISGKERDAEDVKAGAAEKAEADRVAQEQANAAALAAKQAQEAEAATKAAAEAKRQADAKAEMDARQATLDAQAKELADRQAALDAAKAQADKEEAERKAFAETARLAKEAQDKATAEKALADEAARNAAAKAELDLKKAELDAREKVAEEKAAADRLAEAQRVTREKREAEIAAAAPDADKLDAFEKAIAALPVGVMATEAGQRALLGILEARLRFCAYIHVKSVGLTDLEF